VNFTLTEEITAVTEEYLEGIYKLQEKDGAARTGDLVKLLQVAPGTVTNTVERLEREKLVKHVPYKGVKLTGEGRKIAIDVIRKHRLLERLLTDILHMDWDKVHNAACRLEHDITEDVVKSLDKTLGHPTTCPHGNSIPTKYGGITEGESESLADLKLGEKGVVVKITEEEPELLHYLKTLNLKPQVRVEVVEKAPFNGPLTIRVLGINQALSRDVAAIIKVRRI
jgi:DtxR family Mn-dependent transcriptional regulator